MTTREKVLSGALSAFASGQPHVAEKKLRSFLSTNVRDIDARYHYARCLAALGQMEPAIGEYQRVLSAQPLHLPALIDLSVALTMTERSEEALTLLSRVPGQHARRPELQFALGLCQLGRRDWRAAEGSLRLALGWGRAEVYERLAAALLQMRRYDEAAQCLRTALKLNPQFAGAAASLGDAQLQMGNGAAAIDSYRHWAALQPTDAGAHAALGAALLMSDDPAAASLSLEQALALDPRLADAAVNLGTALSRLGRAQAAAAAYERALAMRPGHPEAQLELGCLLADANSRERAIALLGAAFEQRPQDLQVMQRVVAKAESMGVPALALAVYERAAQTMAQHPSIHDAHGQLLQRLGRFAGAVECYARALALEPQRRTAQLNQGHAYESLGDLEKAQACFERVMAANPLDCAALAGNISCALRVCDWERVERTLVQLRAADGLDQLHPFIRFALELRPEELAASARVQSAGIPVCAPSRTFKRPAHARLRVAYLSPDFRRHPVAYALAGVIAHHDRRRIECLGVSLTAPDDSAIARLLVPSFDDFIEAGALGDRCLVEQLRERDIDIAVDLAGFTAGARPTVFASRIAPVQVNYLGFAGSTGAAYMDYMIADATVLPQGEDALYSESIRRMPHCYLPFDNRRSPGAGPPERAALGLPAQGVVFCGFTNGYKISRAIFDVWLRLLQEVPESVLWLRAGPAMMQENIRRTAVERGVSPERLIFAPLIESMDEHLARLQCADLFLDTLPYNAHTTAVEALWAGVPVISCSGRTFAGRVGASALAAAGLTELVADDLGGYFRRALDLAAAPATLASLRKRLSHSRRGAPLFDTARYVRDLEALLWQLAAHPAPP
jgi:predicted O-linked N-acetylglucosamine transferase (SPINDLY family)